MKREANKTLTSSLNLAVTFHLIISKFKSALYLINNISSFLTSVKQYFVTNRLLTGYDS